MYHCYGIISQRFYCAIYELIYCFIISCLQVLVKVHPEGKFVVDLDKNIDMNDVVANARVALRNDSYTLHKILPSKVSSHNIQI